MHLVLAGIFVACLLPLLTAREPLRHEAAAVGAPFGAVAGELWGRRRLLLPLFVG